MNSFKDWCYRNQFTLQQGLLKAARFPVPGLKPSRQQMLNDFSRQLLQYKENIFTDVMSKLVSELEVSERYPPKFSRLIFSGDGGSVGLGHVYMNEHIVTNMRNNRIEETISNYLKNRILPGRLLITLKLQPQRKK